MLAPYAALWRLPGVPRIVLSAFVARIPFGLVGLALLLLVQEQTGSFGIAGAVTGAYGFAAAAASPVVGRLVDRHGQPAVLIPLAAGNAAALVALVALAVAGASTGPLIACAVAGGLCMPPLAASIRALWPEIAGAQAPAAFALEAILLDVFFIVGPTAAALISGLLSPEVAVLTGAALSLGGILAYGTAPAPRRWRGGGAGAGGRLRGGALRSRAIRALLGASLFNGAMFGFVELGLTGFAEERGAVSTAGLLIGALSVGSVLGGLIYGAREHTRPLVRRAIETAFAVAVGLALLLLPGSAALMAAACMVGGLAIAPATTTTYQLIDAVSPRGLQVEANTWLIAASALGVSGGAALGGALVDGWGADAALLATVACALATAMWLAARRRVLVPAA